MIYLDNAATSWPKPECVTEAIVRYMRDIGASPGRSGHRLAHEAERVRLAAREAVATAPRAGADVAHVADDRLGHALRLGPARGRVVEIDHRASCRSSLFA